MTGAGQNDDQRVDLPAEPEGQRRQVLRTAWVLGALALCMYLGFIIATGLRG